MPEPTDLHSEEPPEGAAPNAGQSTEAPVLPQISSDESDVGWGDDPHDGSRDAQWYERERPPHHE